MSFALFLAAALSAAAPEPETKAQAAPRWVVDWGEERCSLVRETGGPRPATLMLRTIPGTAGGEIWLFDARWRSAPIKRGQTVRLRLAPGGPPVTTAGTSFRSSGQWGLILARIEAPVLDRFAASSEISVESDGKVLASVPLPRVGAAMAALRKCEDDTVQAAGFDPGQLRSLRSFPTPKGDPGRWILNQDYPREALRASASGSTLVRIDVAADGRVAGCKVVENFGHPSFGPTTCALVTRRGGFAPAIDRDGAPVASVAAMRLFWLIQ